MDVLFINPGSASETYQELSLDYSAVEPPTWALLLAESCRSVGYSVGIIDVNAERLPMADCAVRVAALAPRLICFVVYGQNVNAGTAQMSGAVKLSEFLKQAGIVAPIAFIGSYVQALPKKVLEDEPSIDFVFTNEGVYALRNLLTWPAITENALAVTDGVAWRGDGKVIINNPSPLVPNHRMDEDLPGYAWDLLPPLKLYRSSLWHARFDENSRGPYAAIYTSLGCAYGCGFCMINILNRCDKAEIGVASNYRKMRFWSPEFVVKQICKLLWLGVGTIRITDEMFLLNRNHYMPLCEKLKQLGVGDRLNMWAYSRVDTVADKETLELIKSAGIKGLCLGIESGDRGVRLEIEKGVYKDVDVRRVIEQIHDAGIEVLANYIFGLPGDTMETMQKTLDLSIELCTSGWNAYAAMALPGSQLYKTAVDTGCELPNTYSGFAFHSYDCLPMRTDACTAAEILRFRDNAFHIYHSNPAFLARIERLYGKEAVDVCVKMNSVRLKRAIYS